MNDLPIDKGTKVTLHFALKFTDGQIVDSTFEKEPATLEIGDDNLPENFEAYLLGLKAGARETFEVPAGKGGSCAGLEHSGQRSANDERLLF